MTAPAPAVAEPQPDPLAAQIGRIAGRAAASLDCPDGDWQLAAGYTVLGIPRIADGLAALPILEAARGRHQPIRWSEKHRGAIGAEDSDVVACSCGHGAHPCPEAVALGWPWPPLSPRTPDREGTSAL